MTRVKNKRNAPLVVPTKEGAIYFAPLEIQTLSDKAMREPLIQSNIKRGNLQVLPEGPISVEAEVERRPKKGGVS
ncbi:MAG: hypothetical protein HPY71_13520 [Firmicutes bacterium]|nr:hypothetical protein [Bacillota bacterium]